MASSQQAFSLRTSPPDSLRLGRRSPSIQTSKDSIDGAGLSAEQELSVSGEAGNTACERPGQTSCSFPVPLSLLLCLSSICYSVWSSLPFARLFSLPFARLFSQGFPVPLAPWCMRLSWYLRVTQAVQLFRAWAGPWS